MSYYNSGTLIELENQKQLLLETLRAAGDYIYALAPADLNTGELSLVRDVEILARLDAVIKQVTEE